MADPAPRLAVVVLSWEGREDTLRCLEALRPELGPGDAAIVCDNGSTDGTADAVAAAHPWAEVIRNGANLGFAGGNEPGMRRALDRGFRWVMLLNNDARPEKGALAALLAFAESRAGAGAFQPLLLSEADPSRVDSLGIRISSGPGARDDGMGSPASEAPSEPREVFGACAAAALYRAEALRAAGLLDRDLFVLFEDVDLAFRLQAAGFGAWLVPAARVLHRRGVSGGSGARRVSRIRAHFLRRNFVTIVIRWWPASTLLHATPRLLVHAIRALASGPGVPVATPSCLALWRRALAARRANRRALAARGVDRWLE
ncbi:MAG TPA: glycosyltransferase family 2 protein [Planctomycetota bacterium]|nr:glycosyltransferase family 2 protein [Planctomycetota bacterium]